MSRNEDYLDNLLTSVTDTLSQFDDDFEQNRESLKQSYQTQNNLPPKTQSALDEIREDNFLKEFEEDMQDGGSDDDFMRDFERELRGEMQDSEDEYEGIPEEISEGTSLGSETDYADMDADLNDILSDFSDMPDMPQEDADVDLDMDATAAFEDASIDMPTQQEPVSAPDGFEGLEDIFSDMSDAPPEGMGDDIATQAQPQSLETVQLDEGLDEQLTQMQTEEPALSSGAPTQEDDGPSLDDILNESDDVLTQLENFVENDGSAENTANTENAGSLDQDQISALLAGEGNEKEDSISLLEPTEAEKVMEQDPFSMGPDFAYDESAAPDASAGKKKKREKNPNSIFAKISRVLFGSAEELNPELAAEIAAEKAKLGEDHPANMSPEALKAKKKEEKELKKQKKKEEAELKKQEKDAAKAEKAAKKASKPKKEKKPKKKKELPKEPPLPKGPVTVMWVLAFSIMAIVFLGTSALGYFSTVNQSKEAFDKGDYVTAYEKLQGVKIKKADEDLYHATAALAGVQMELDAYTALMEQKQYEMALDALIRGIGRCQIHEKDAEEWSMTKQLSEMESQLGTLLSDQFNVSKRTARKLYKIQKRSEYTLRLHEIMSKLGLYEAVA